MLKQTLEKLTAYKNCINQAPFVLLQELVSFVGAYKLVGVVDYGGEAIVLKVQDPIDHNSFIALKIALLNFQGEGERHVRNATGKNVEVVSSWKKLFSSSKSQHSAVLSKNDKKRRYLEGCKIQERLEKQLVREHIEYFKIPTVLQISEKPLFLSMEYIESVSILHYLRDSSKTLQDSLNIFIFLLDAVYYMHRQGIIHRDLKSENLMVWRNEAKQDIPVILDFTVSKEIGDRDLTVVDSFIGTTSYMSPKSLTGGAKDYTFCDDILSLGLILHEFSTREKIQRYLTREDLQKKSEAELYNLYTEYRELLSNSIVSPLKSVFLKATAPEEVDRYNFVPDFKKDLLVAIKELGFSSSKCVDVRKEKEEQLRKEKSNKIKIKKYYEIKCLKCKKACKLGICYSLAIQQFENLEFFMREDLL